MTVRSTASTPDLSSRDPNWWRQAVIYQVYPRSFADADGDGLGDLRGVTQRLTHLAALGVDALWLSPFYPSELADGGYDVDDYRDVDPRLGTLDDFDAMAAEAHRLGLKVIVDLVPNHTSHRHAWFREALRAGPGSAARDRYVFRDGRGEHGELPPTDWQSVFGGSAWQRVPDGQWYLHLFAPQQPDLNWENEQVRADFRTTLRFWSDRGVDGFRVDVAHALVKDLAEPLRDLGAPELSGEAALTEFAPGTHPFYDRDDVHEVYRDWRKILDAYTPPRTAVAEAWVPGARRALYARPDELGQAFNFEYLQTGWNPAGLREVITGSLADARAAGASATWVLSNHDVVRHATRLVLPPDTDTDAWLLSGGRAPAVDAAAGLRRARAATLLMLALPGSAYLYQGEELGLPEVADLPTEVLQDPIWEQTGHVRKGRDGCRVPLPWTTDGPSYGFGAGGAWLPQPPDYAAYAVQAQDGVAGSTLELYR
ncbi:glycoside hydrolase family 13 protein, partial [Streptomyces coelicoflavus]|nr:glycoside hydrolase family 13 protein [Streptomyces coelicoflavus]